MIQPLERIWSYLRETINRHGGGWRGTHAVARRAFRVLRAIGWKGFADRLRASRARLIPPPSPPETLKLAPATSAGAITLRVGVMAHIFYPDLTDELAHYLSHIPQPFTLLVSVVDALAKQQVTERLQKLDAVQQLHVRVVPNRGRDLAPFFVTFRDEILALDAICHIHTKKSLYTGREQSQWRRHMLDALLGSQQRVTALLGLLQANPALGMVYPDGSSSVPLWAHTWLSNLTHARQLGARLGIGIDAHSYIDFPAGSMFWARVAALRPLFALQLTLEDFPEEVGQTDGTLQHTLERMLGMVTRHQGLLTGVLPADGSLALQAEGLKSWSNYVEQPLKEKIAYACIDARVISLDIFDTLVLRPFLSPWGARVYAAHRIQAKFGIPRFMELRERAEALARAKAEQDVDLDTIYAAMATLPEIKHVPIDELYAFEVALEKQLMRPRVALLDALAAIPADRRLIAVSDMYLDAKTLKAILPTTVSKPLQQLYVSCDTGWRKDTAEAWKQLPEKEDLAAEQWLHIGDNEHADVQLPQQLGFIHPVHVLRPAALLQVAPPLRRLRPPAAVERRWQDQLWLGLLSNRFSELADTHPTAFSDTLRIDDAQTLGYVVYGPLILDYVAWLARLAQDQVDTNILFLSREGVLLQRIFRVLQEAAPSLGSIKASYLLASRRGTTTPSLREMDDLQSVLQSPYTGSLEGFLRHRLGAAIADLARSTLQGRQCDQEIFLPDMREQVEEMLRPLFKDIRNIADLERRAYMAYWRQHAGTGNVIVADLGYAGSIQTNLARLTGQTIGGAYFAVNQGITQTQLYAGWARARLYDARTDAAQPVPAILRHDLLMEAVLTAPEGQFSHMELAADGPRPVYVDTGPSPATWAVISRIHDGVEAFVRDVCAVTGADTIELSFDRDHIQIPLACLADGTWQAGSWAERLTVDDAYTGRGTVPFATA
ncbi:rhamnan synthesis F family protein [Oleiagrimonas sp. C23AA]|uniref:rhamnan synthesis F family protein n=1 Tax=Oleiagrimonas sp. C23AA TaxID=2719047 RepID=UPI00141E7713|nr:rhamnan synthesis F family protein [Oleiagrimonas sp. C23AA]NII12127.1 polysaccharide biosynthesis protein [Oleiagrimonas sp. C23AA]